MGKPTKLRQVPSRKQRRKQERAAKKARVSSYFSRSKEGVSIGGGVRETASDGRLDGRGRGVQRRSRLTSEQRRPMRVGWNKGSSTAKVGSRGRGWKGVEPTPLERRAALLSANRREDRMISQLEKLLKLKRRKNKKLPSSFEADGLGCILTHVRLFSHELYTSMAFNFIRTPSSIFTNKQTLQTRMTLCLY